MPFLVVGKEISREDVRIGLEKMADRFFEHPQMVLVVTNMTYFEAPSLYPINRSARAALNWNELKLTGNTAHEFEEQIRELEPNLNKWWQTRPSEKTGNPVYAEPSVLLIYRQDQAIPLSAVIPQKGQDHREYDIIVASQPYRLRQPAAIKVKQVLAPLAKSLSSGGCMVVIQSTGKDPGMEIVRKIWPDENPFQTPRQMLLRELNSQIGHGHPDLNYLSYPDSQAEFQYRLRVTDQEVDSVIGTSTLLAAWNAATYVAQIEDHRLSQAMRTRDYLDAAADVLRENNGLWFTDESFIVARK